MSDDYIEDDGYIIFSVSPDDDNGRIDSIIAGNTEGFTRSRIQKLIISGYVSVNGSTITNKNYRVNAEDSIALKLPAPDKVDILPENLPLNILYEDNDIIIVDKIKGMVVHPAPGHYSGTLVNALMYHLGDNLSGINGELRPGIVHRIDMDTSGILVVCKNDSAHNFLADLLSRHDINRVYYCLVFGVFKEKEGSINAPIGRHPIDRKKMCVNRKNGREAITHYKVIDEFLNKYSLLECKLETGRTHQIRVHMSYLNHPLVGDKVYGKEKQPFNTDGQMLHAAILGFVHPSTGKYIEFSSPLPEYFCDIIRKISSGNFQTLYDIQTKLAIDNNGE